MFCALEVLLQWSVAYAALPFLAVLVKAVLYFCVVVKTPFTFIIDVGGKGCLQSTEDFWVPTCLTMHTGSIGSVSAVVTAYTTSF